MGHEINVISETIQEFDGERFYLCGHYFQHNGKRLHRAVWEAHNGPIPEGYHVHHIDENRRNNEIENLSLMPGIEHLNLHLKSERNRKHGREVILLAIQKAPEWHRSPEGKKWHSEQSKKHWGERVPKSFKCDCCGKMFKSMTLSEKGNHFCSNNCKSKFRRDSGADDIEAQCPVCGKIFVKNKYEKQKCCCRSCGRKLKRCAS